MSPAFASSSHATDDFSVAARSNVEARSSSSRVCVGLRRQETSRADGFGPHGGSTRCQGEVMSERSGPFWDAVEGRAPMPRAAATLGFEFIDADVEKGTIELAFTATEDFTNPTGNVLGAFVAA